MLVREGGDRQTSYSAKITDDNAFQTLPRPVDKSRGSAQQGVRVLWVKPIPQDQLIDSCTQRLAVLEWLSNVTTGPRVALLETLHRKLDIKGCQSWNSANQGS
jgi:hypothetical protein